MPRLGNQEGKLEEVSRVRKQSRSLLEKESMGFVEKASLFHLNKENTNFKKNSLESLKIKISQAFEFRSHHFL